MKTPMLEIESQLAAGQTPKDLDQSYSARVLMGNYKMAEGLAWINQSQVQKLRSFISRGAVNEAKLLLQDHPQMESEEILFEQARAFVFEANFLQALEILEPLLKSGKLTPLSIMTAYQLKGLCEFELGFYEESLNSLDRVFSFETVFPNAEASLFAASIRIRCLYEMKALFNIEEELDNLWTKILSGQFFVNKKFQLIVYLLSSCHIKRNLNHCLAGIKLSQEMGSPIHEGIFLAYLNSLGDDSQLESEVRSFHTRFPYVRHVSHKIKKSEETKELHIRSQRFDSLIFLKYNYRYSISEDQFHPLNLTPQNLALIHLFQNGSLEKEALFEAHWKSPYNPLIHDTKIRTSLKRIREQAGIEILSENSLLSIPHALLLD